MERWKPVVGFEGRYEVSDMGRVRSYLCPSGKKLQVPHLMSVHCISQKYPSVTLIKDNKKRLKLVHQLILKAFTGPRPEGYDSAHLDGNPGNSILKNLAWVTKKENMRHREVHGRTCRGEKVIGSKLTEEEVKEIRRLRSLLSEDKIKYMKSHRIKSPYSLMSLSRKFNVSKKLILNIVKRKSWAWVN